MDKLFSQEFLPVLSVHYNLEKGGPMIYIMGVKKLEVFEDRTLVTATADGNISIIPDVYEIRIGRDE